MDVMYRLITERLIISAANAVNAGLFLVSERRERATGNCRDGYACDIG